MGKTMVACVVDVHVYKCENVDVDGGHRPANGPLVSSPATPSVRHVRPSWTLQLKPVQMAQRQARSEPEQDSGLQTGLLNAAASMSKQHSTHVCGKPLRIQLAASSYVLTHNANF